MLTLKPSNSPGPRQHHTPQGQASNAALRLSLVLALPLIGDSASRWVALKPFRSAPQCGSPCGQVYPLSNMALHARAESSRPLTIPSRRTALAEYHSAFGFGQPRAPHSARTSVGSCELGSEGSLTPCCFMRSLMLCMRSAKFKPRESSENQAVSISLETAPAGL
jgi:hypothetical protein